MDENQPVADDRGSRETAQTSESQQTSGCSGNTAALTERRGWGIVGNLPLVQIPKARF